MSADRLPARSRQVTATHLESKYRLGMRPTSDMLDRTACHAEGHGFEPRQPRQWLLDAMNGSLSRGADSPP